jgi:hypothetical protein
MARTIKEIPPEEADRICKDVQLWWMSTLEGWKQDLSTEEYREGKYVPSYWGLKYGIEVELDKPEYTPEHLRCDHG